MALNMADRLEQQKSIDIDLEELKRFNEEMVTSNLITPDQLYADLALFKDYNIGALASFQHENRDIQTATRRHEIYQSMLDALPDYQNRQFDDIAHYFPRFGVSNDEIQTRLHDPYWSSYIFHHAPLTPYINTMRGQIAVNVNHSAVIGKRDPIELTINTYPIRLSEINRHFVGLYFANLLRTTVRVIYLDMTKVRLHDISSYDEIYTYYFVDLFKAKDIRDAYSALKFIRKRLYAPKLFGPTVNPMIDTKKEELIVKSHCDVLTLFSFVHPRLFSAMLPEKPSVDQSDNEKKDA